MVKIFTIILAFSILSNSNFIYTFETFRIIKTDNKETDYLEPKNLAFMCLMTMYIILCVGTIIRCVHDICNNDDQILIISTSGSSRFLSNVWAHNLGFQSHYFKLHIPNYQTWWHTMMQYHLPLYQPMYMPSNNFLFLHY